MYVVIWEFEVRPERVAEFQSIYAPQGEWAQLFRLASGYLGTELLRCADSPSRFLTVDRWRASRDLTDFEERFRETYSALDARCESLTLSERKLGAFLEVSET
jgi:heme-degrading monooxygenase HmoA